MPRHPTSHERDAGRPWDASYQHAAPAPWDIGRPQAAFVRVASEGGFTGPVLDAGCGTGEHALLAASLGLPVLGVDLAESAIAIARTKAAERGLDADFAVADAFDLGDLGRKFATVLDCGLFHTCDEEERLRYADSLAAATDSGATLYVLCFSDSAPAIGPHPVSENELRAAFDERSGWHIGRIEPEVIQTTFVESGIGAWFAKIERR